MIRNITKGIAILLGLIFIGQVVYAMEKEPESKKFKFDIESIRREGAKEQAISKEKEKLIEDSILKPIQDGNLELLKKNLEAWPLLSRKKMLNVVYTGTNYRALPLKLALDMLLHADHSKQDIYRAIVEELVKSGADINVASYYYYSPGYPNFLDYYKKYYPFLETAVTRGSLSLIEFLLKNGADPDEKSAMTMPSAIERINGQIHGTQKRLDQGGRQKTPIKTKKIREKIEQEIKEFKKTRELLNYYKEHYVEFREQQERAFEERVVLQELQKDLEKIEAQRIQSEQLRRPEHFTPEFLESLGRK